MTAKPAQMYEKTLNGDASIVTPMHSADDFKKVPCCRTTTTRVHAKSIRKAQRPFASSHPPPDGAQLVEKSSGLYKVTREGGEFACQCGIFFKIGVCALALFQFANLLHSCSFATAFLGS